MLGGAALSSLDELVLEGSQMFRGPSQRHFVELLRWSSIPQKPNLDIRKAIFLQYVAKAFSGHLFLLVQFATAEHNICPRLRPARAIKRQPPFGAAVVSTSSLL